MKDDLISRSALLELYADTDEIKFDVYNVPVPVVRQNILDMPTIDAEPVRHGRWVDKMVRDWHCSECGKKARFDGYCYDDKPNYCPNCGAKMDGGADHNQA